MKKLVFGLSVLMAAGAMASECKLKMDSSGWYAVNVNGQRMNDWTKDVDQALSDIDELAQYNMCSQPIPQKECKISMDSSNWYQVTLNGSRISKWSKSLAEVSKIRNKLIRKGICYNQTPQYKCELDRDSSNWWSVKAGTKRVSKYIKGSPADINALAQEVADEGICYMSSYTPQPTRSYDVQSNEVNYVYDFRGSAENLSERIISLVKTLEPYINNAHEEEMDDIKKKAARLKARAHTRDIVKLATTARELEAIMDRNEGYMMELMETDALDRLSIELITISENLKAMLDYLQVQSQDYM